MEKKRVRDGFRHRKVVAVGVLAAGVLLALPGWAQAPSISDLKQGQEAIEGKQDQIIQQGDQVLRRLDALDRKIVPGTATESPVVPSEFEEKLRELEEQLGALQVAPGSADEASAALSQDNINAVWIVIAAALVFLMQAGFCMLELGSTRAKNSINVCMKNFLDFSVGTIAFLFIGATLMFGNSIGGWFGSGPFWLSSIGGDNLFWAFWMFQVVFAGTAATIISGAMAERTKFIGYVLFTIFMVGLIYPIVGHWAWGSLASDFGFGSGGGWLEKIGFADFAGSTVVHGIGGACALAGLIVIGPRLGRFDKAGRPRLLVGHNLPLAALGTFILWFGWYGFNAGSTLVGDAAIGRIAVNTTISPSMGAITGMLIMWLYHGRPDLTTTLNGALGGLVGITANCDSVSPASAVAIGMISGIIVVLGTILLEKMRIDDAVGAVPVHLFCGWWGTIAVALFAESGFSAEALGIQAMGTLVMTGSAFAAAFLVFKIVDMVIGLRASDEEQDHGLDFSEHSANAYPDFMTGEQFELDEPEPELVKRV